jgi:hypothetical protein
MFSPSRAKKVPPNSPEEIQKFLKMFAEEKSGTLCCQGRFLVPREGLPRRGMVDAMLTISPAIGDAQMAVTGVSFDIENNPPYQRLRWKLKSEKKSAVELEVDIETIETFEEGGSLLENMSNVLWSGVQQLVLEVTSDAGA